METTPTEHPVEETETKTMETKQLKGILKHSSYNEVQVDAMPSTSDAELSSPEKNLNLPETCSDQEKNATQSKTEIYLSPAQDEDEESSCTDDVREEPTHGMDLLSIKDQSDSEDLTDGNAKTKIRSKNLLNFYMQNRYFLQRKVYLKYLKYLLNSSPNYE